MGEGLILNEHDKHAAAWLRNLIAEEHLPPGVVDERDIQELKADDLRPHKHVHLFAGIGGWPLALKLAGWPDDRPVWTGSCPCQPFSSAGKRKGNKDERHLWPVMFRLIRECRPGVVFGEQVASAVGHGWLDGVFADLEGEGYACGAVVLGAHSVGAPHIRQRLYWVAESSHVGHEWSGTARRGRDGLADGGDVGGLGDTGSERVRACGCGTHDESAPGVQGQTWERKRVRDDAWAASHVISCRDGKHRRIPIEQSFFPLVAGLSTGRVGILRGAGNAIVPQVAAEFVMAYMEVA